MGALIRLLSGLEQAIRYLLTGFAVAMAIFFGIEHSSTHIEQLTSNLTFSAAVMLGIGATFYIAYRTIFYVLIDGLAWQLGWSAPIKDGFCYSRPHSNFLRWRYGSWHSDNSFGAPLNKELSGYLHLRWAGAHFFFMLTILLQLLSIFRRDNSLFKQYVSDEICLCALVLFHIASFVIAIWQISFMFRVERDLYRLNSHDRHRNDCRVSTKAGGS